MSKVNYRKIRWGEELPSDWQPPETLKLLHNIRHRIDKETKGMNPNEMKAYLSKKRRYILEKHGYKMILTEDGGYKLERKRSVHQKQAI